MVQENKRCFIDSNIWLYALTSGGDDRKESRSIALISEVIPVLSTQVVNEVCANVLKWSATAEEKIVSTIQMFFNTCDVRQIDVETLLFASRLRKSYSFSFWDSLIVSSALDSHAEILYSEDMQHGLIVENRLTILNPFLAPKEKLIG